MSSLMILMIGCSSDQQLEDELDATEEGLEEVGQGIDASLNGNEGFDNGGENFAGNENEGFANGEDLNNSEDNEFGENNDDFADNNANFNNSENGDDFGNQFANNENDGNEDIDNFGINENDGEENTFTDEGAESLLAASEGQGMQEAAEGDLMLTDETQEVGPPEGGMAPEMPSFTPQPGDRGTVRYALERINVLSKPEGQVVKTMDRGDHNLVWEDGEWLRNSRGSFLPPVGMSMDAIARPSRSNNWR